MQPFNPSTEYNISGGGLFRAAHVGGKNMGFSKSKPIKWLKTQRLDASMSDRNP